MVDVADVPFDKIGGLTISPQTDIPFGKPFQMGLAVYTIYDKTVVRGFNASVRTHNSCSLVMLDDVQFSEGLQRAHFIAEWASVFLGRVHDLQEEAHA